MIAKEKKERLSQMEFGELRRVIDYCLHNEELIDNKYVSIVTDDLNIISEYTDILERKNRPLFSPLEISPPSNSKSVSQLKEESKQLIATEQLKLSATLIVTERQQHKLDEELCVLQKELDRITLEASTDRTENESEEGESESPIKDRLLFWINIMQSSKRNPREAVKRGNISGGDSQIKQQLDQLKKASIRLIQSIQIQKEKKDRLVSVFNSFVSDENKRNFYQEVRIQNNKADREIDLKRDQYESSYNAKLRKYEDSIPARIVKRIRSDIAKSKSYELSAERLNWKLLPLGEMPFERIRDYLQGISKLGSDEFDYEKIGKIVSLEADKVYCGVEEFEGYLVFYFDQIKIAVFDCPKKGNAIYIFGEDWKTLSRLTKSNLLNYYPTKTKRIIHRGNWFDKLKSLLETHYKNYQFENQENLSATD